MINLFLLRTNPIIPRERTNIMHLYTPWETEYHPLLLLIPRLLMLRSPDPTLVITKTSNVPVGIIIERMDPDQRNAQDRYLRDNVWLTVLTNFCRTKKRRKLSGRRRKRRLVLLQLSSKRSWRRWGGHMNKRRLNVRDVCERRKRKG